MSFNAGGPNGPNVPPPPGQGSGGPYDGPGPQGQPNEYGAPPGPGHPNPYGATPGQPEQKSKKNLIIGLVVGAVLLLLLCCGGALLLARDDDDSSTDPTTGTTTSETTDTTTEPTTDPTTDTTTEPTTDPTTETTEPTSGTAGGDIEMPEEFDGWKKVDLDVDAPAGSQVAAYSKGSEGFSMVVMDDMPGIMDGFESLWSEAAPVGDAQCGKYSGQTQCAQIVDDKVFLATSGGDTSDTARMLGIFLDAI